MTVTPFHRKYFSRQSVSSEDSIDDTIVINEKRPFGLDINFSNTEVDFITTPKNLAPFKTPKNKKVSNQPVSFCAANPLL
jgi:hypothetical protein